MANHKSAIKRAKQNEKRRMRNKSVRTRVKNVTKGLLHAVSESSKEDAVKELIAAQSTIDIAAKKGVLHSRTASRKISRLTKLVNSISA